MGAPRWGRGEGGGRGEQGEKGRKEEHGRRQRQKKREGEGGKRAKLQDTRSVLLSAQYVSFMTIVEEREREREGGARRKIDGNLSRSRNTRNKSATQ